MELSFRNAEQKDLPRIVAIYNSTIASRMVTADTEEVTVESRQRWFEEHNTTNRPLWVVETADAETVGWVSFQSFYGRPAYGATVEVSIYVDEAHRGRGFGKQILEYCIRTAPQLGVQTLLGFIFAHNPASLQLFRHFGFGDWAHLPRIAVLDGVERDLLILGKRVG